MGSKMTRRELWTNATKILRQEGFNEKGVSLSRRNRVKQVRFESREMPPISRVRSAGPDLVRDVSIPDTAICF